MRRNVDIQTASEVGPVVWSSGPDRGGNVGVQQFAKIAGRDGDKAGTVSVGCDGDGTERSSLKRELEAERPAVAEGWRNFAVPGKCGLLCEQAPSESP